MIGAAVLDDILGVIALAFLYQFAVIGEITLTFTQVGLSNGILNAELYAALLIVIALTTALPPFALKWIYARWDGNAEWSA